MGLIVAVGLAEAISVATVFESIAAVGAVLSVVGKVTGDKTLSMIGLGLGVVGGVGALASGAFAAAGAVGDAADGAAAASGAAGGGTDAVAGASADVAAGAVSDAAPAVEGATDAVAGGTEQFAGIAPGQEASVYADGYAGGTGAAAAPVDSAATSAASSTAAPDAANVIGDIGAQKVFQTNAVAGGDWTSSGGSGVSGMLGDLAAFAGKNPTIAFGALQAGGSLLSGLTSTLTPAQVALANAQAAQAQASAGLLAQQTANLGQAKAVAAPVAVTGTPAPILTGQTGQNGLINSITGKPA